MLKREMSAAEVLEELGRVLSDDSKDWQQRLANALGVRRDTVRDWRSGRLNLRPDHPVFGDLMSMVQRRRAELGHAEDELTAWLESNRNKGD
jgi:hypothetical protein